MLLHLQQAMAMLGRSPTLAIDIKVKSRRFIFTVSYYVLLRLDYTGTYRNLTVN
jgi:hypothetical protein